MPDRDERTEIASQRIFHNRLGDVLVTTASARAIRGQRVDPIEIALWLAEIFREVTVLVWEDKNVFLVQFNYHQLFVLIFKAALLPGERSWNKFHKAWYVKKDAVHALERMCKVFGVPLNYMGDWNKRYESLGDSESEC